MIYNLLFGMLEGAQRFPLITNNQNIVYLGGHPNPDKAGLSKLEIERLAALCSRQQVGYVAIGPRHFNNTQVKQLTLSVVIPDLVTTIVSPAPRDFPKSVKDPKAMEIASQYAANCGNRCSGELSDW